jgi:transcriptional regulator with XRE-family HTH domain
MAQILTPERLRAYLRNAIDGEGWTQAAFAEKFGFSAQYLGDVLNGRRDPGDKILNAIGYERVVTYRPKKTAAA